VHLSNVAVLRTCGNLLRAMASAHDRLNSPGAFLRLPRWYDPAWSPKFLTIHLW
jgi:hypothetical protein